MKRERLERWVAIWHRPYRGLLGQLLLIGTLVGGLIYLENSFLKGLVQSLSATPAADGSFFASLFRRLGGPELLSWLFLGAVFLVGLSRALLGARRDILSARMEVKARNDLERQILLNLLLQDDAFFSSHSAGEILNRLEVDLFRILDRRDVLVTVWWSVLIVLGNLIFFAIADWRLALVVVFISLVGIFITEYVSRPLKGSDAEYFRASDQVKMDFEDYLKAIPEIQVGGLYHAMIQRFRRPQDQRVEAFFRWIKGNTRVRFVRVFWPVLAFLAAVLVVVYSYMGGDAEGTAKLALIPVLIFAMPRIFENVTGLVGHRLTLQLAKNSVDRITEYDCGLDVAPDTGDGGEALASPDQAEPPPQRRDTDPRREAQPVRLEGISYRYRTSDGEPQGGVSDVDAEFSASTWTALVGGAGSGKSTVCNILLGRLAPEEGTVRIGETALSELSAERRWRLATLMPQRVVLFDTTIAENLLIGRGTSGGELSRLREPDVEILEGIGLAEICRLKALDMSPVDPERHFSKEQIQQLRREAREILSRLKLNHTSFSEEEPDPERPLFEGLLGGRTHLKKAIEGICQGSHSRWGRSLKWVKKLAESPLGEELAAVGRSVVDRSRNLLEMESYEAFAALSPVLIDREIWEARRNCVMALERKRSSWSVSGTSELKGRLVRIGLTSKLSEAQETALPGEGQLDRETLEKWRKNDDGALNLLRKELEGCFSPLKKDALNPTLSWRDNLLFARLHLTNNRQGRKVDEALLELMKRPEWNESFVRQGLLYRVGRNGSRLSGGQCQLVSMGRSLLRRTPVVVLDEPTSALDPARRDAVVEFLQKWKSHRVLITISHDPVLAQAADAVCLMRDGRLAAQGTYTELLESSEAFQQIFRS